MHDEPGMMSAWFTGPKAENAPFFAAWLAPSRSSRFLRFSASIVLLSAPSRKPSLACRSKWSAATTSWPCTPLRLNSTVSL